MAGEIKDMDDAFPYGLSPECVAHGHGLGESGLQPCWASTARFNWSASTSAMDCPYTGWMRFIRRAIEKRRTRITKYDSWVTYGSRRQLRMPELKVSSGRTQKFELNSLDTSAFEGG